MLQVSSRDWEEGYVVVVLRGFEYHQSESSTVYVSVFKSRISCLRNIYCIHLKYTKA